jgi:HAD superfamily hydrolase (TIGR01509 family)
LDHIDPALVRDVDLLSLDAGNTIIFLDHARLAASCARRGFDATAPALVVAEGHAKVALECGEALDLGWVADAAGSRTWGLVVGTLVARAGLPAARVAAMLDALWSDHRAHNFWTLVPEGLPSALALLRAGGVRVVVVSNSEGTLAGVLRSVGLGDAFDHVIDSGLVGVEKPDPAIFRFALDAFALAPERVLHLGDTYSTDVVGARAAGMRVALIDPHGHFAGRHGDVPRVPGTAEVAHAILAARAGTRT